MAAGVAVEGPAALAGWAAPAAPAHRRVAAERLLLVAVDAAAVVRAFPVLAGLREEEAAPVGEKGKL